LNNSNKGFALMGAPNLSLREGTFISLIGQIVIKFATIIQSIRLL